MALVADRARTLVAELGEAAALAMHLADERAGRVDHVEAALARLLLHPCGHAMGARTPSLRPAESASMSLDEDRALAATAGRPHAVLWTISWRT
jgi:hypothetical protein